MARMGDIGQQMEESLHSGGKMESNALNVAIKKHESLPFPKVGNHQKWNHWLGELAGVDAFYVGLAYSVLAGKEVQIENLDPLHKLVKSFDIVKQVPGDKELVKACKEYLHSLETIAHLLKD